MESLPCTRDPQDWSPNLHPAPTQGLVARLLCAAFRTSDGSFFYSEEEITPPTSGPCSIELSDHDSSFFQAVLDPLLEVELDSYEFVVTDLRPSAAISDWGILCSYDPNDDFESASSSASVQREIVKDTLRALVGGFVIHLVALPAKKSALKAGDEMESFRDKVLSAIHQAAYFPRAPSRKWIRHHFSTETPASPRRHRWALTGGTDLCRSSRAYYSG